jgi:hypothetical protein
MMTIAEWEYQLRIWGAPRSANYADVFVEALDKLGPAAAHLAALYTSPEVDEASSRRADRQRQLGELFELHRTAYARRAE